MASSSKSNNKLSEADVQREVDEINALLAGLDEDESWVEELNLNNTKNQSNQQLVTDGLLDASFDGFDATTGNSWMFPIGFEKRDYQLNISRNTLFQNTLVILPTGLGKTLIASVTIYNFLRWYPRSKIIFMAPTRPLVNQQVSACYEVVGIPKEETAEMTGATTKKAKRKELWDSKRVFFATPQVVAADMADGILPTHLIKLLVFDEAHKAKGEYAYCKVINEALKVQNKFRVLALTATAGKSHEVIQIIQNLIISKIEYRSENSLDVRPYTHQKIIETVKVKLTFELQQIYDRIVEYADPMITEIRQAGFVQCFTVSKGYLIMEQNKIRECKTISDSQRSLLMGLINTVSGLYYSLEILERHSVHLFLRSLKEDTGKFKYFIYKNQELLWYIKELEDKFRDCSPFQEITPDGQSSLHTGVKLDFGHPKFDILKTKLENYFKNGGGKAIIFCEYRDTTTLIEIALMQLKPLVTSKCLIGQGGKITQKAQLKIMSDFRDGQVNTLVCTCVAEEGLDIGAVDLVICFDIGSKNSTRFVQRIGRTARKRTGRVIILATEGRELQMIKDLVKDKDTMNQSISRNKDIAKYFYNSPRLVPPQFKPECIETKFHIAKVEIEVKKEKGKKGKGTKVKPQSSKESITDFFKRAPAKRKSRAVAQKIDEDDDDVIEIRENDNDKVDRMEVDDFNIEPHVKEIEDINAQMYIELHTNRINQFIKDNQLEDNQFLKDLLEYRSKEGVESIKQMADLLNAPPPKDGIFGTANFDGFVDAITLSPVKMPDDYKNDDHYSYLDNDQLKAVKSSPFVPVKSRPDMEFATPDFALFKQQQRKMSASTPLHGRSLAFDTNDIFQSQVPQPIEPEPVPASNFPFLGINSLSDIFEGCTTNVFEEVSTHNSPKEIPVEKNELSQDFNKDEPSIEELENSLHDSYVDENHSQRQEDDKHEISMEDLEKSLHECYLNNNQEPAVPSENKLACTSSEESLTSLETQLLNFDPQSQPAHEIHSQVKSPNEVDHQSRSPQEIDHIAGVEDFEVKNKEVFKKFNIDDITDLFGNDKSNDSSNASTKTEVYDVEEEMTRIDRDRRPRVICDEIVVIPDNQESEVQPQKPASDNFKENSGPLDKSSTDHMSIDNILNAIETNILTSPQSFPSCSKSVLKSQNINSPQDSFMTPMRRKAQRALMYDSTPEIHTPSRRISPKRPIDEETSNDDCATDTPKVKRKKRKNGKTQNPFICTQVDVDDDEEGTSDEDENDMTTLGGFVVANETVCDPLDRTRMHLKYLESLRSPNAPVNRNFLSHRQLKPVSLSQIYSQIPDEEECEEEEVGSDMDSFIVNSDEIEEEDHSCSEIDELEEAEQQIREQRRMKRLNLSGDSDEVQQRSKKRKVMRVTDSSSSEDEDMKQLRREVNM